MIVLLLLYAHRVQLHVVFVHLLARTTSFSSSLKPESRV